MPPSAQRAAVFICNGEYWTVGFTGSTFSLRDLKGLNYIQRLLQYPGQYFPALELVAGPGVVQADPQSPATDIGALLDIPGVNVRLPDEGGEVLDQQARREYQRRYDELKEELEEASERRSVERADEIRLEMEFLEQEVRSALQKNKQTRRAPSEPERARISVKHAIKAALQRIADHDASLGDVLAHSIKTGRSCVYSPSAQNVLVWRFTAEHADEANHAQTFAPASAPRQPGLARLVTNQTTFVGREAERARLRKSLEQALGGRPTVVLIGGAPGVGKTRLAVEASVEAAERGLRVLRGDCYDREDAIPFGPVVEVLESALTEDPAGFKEALGADAAEMARLIPQLRRVFPDIPRPLETEPQQLRSFLFRAVLELLIRAAGNRPILIQLEDLHWADEGTLSLLTQFVRSVSAGSMMIIGTYRDNELDPDGFLARTIDELIRLHVVERITLEGLSRDAVAEMLTALSGHVPPEEVLGLIYSNTEGNPFFIEELFQHLVERGKLLDSNGEFCSSEDLAEVDIPQSLRLVIGRRLAALSDQTQRILSTAAVIGRSFPLDLLEAAVRAEVDWLLDRVEEAEKAGLVSSTLEGSQARFHFSHELIRRAAIANLSGPRRQRVHLQVAEAIERTHAENLEDHASDLAHHLWQAGSAADVGKTRTYLAMAGNRAVEQGAYEAALPLLQNALELVKKCSDSAERAELELDLQINYGRAMWATKGYYVPEVGNAYQRANELCARSDPRLLAVLNGLHAYHCVRGEHPIAKTYAEQIIHLAALHQNEGLVSGAYFSSGLTNFFMGRFAAAHADFEQGISLYDRVKHGSIARKIGQDPCVCCLCYDAMTLGMLGYQAQAEERSESALRLAREIGDPFTLTWCIANTIFKRAIFHENRPVDEMEQEGLALAKEHGFVFYENLIANYGVVLGYQGVRRHRIPNQSRPGTRVSQTGYDLAGTWARCEIAEHLGRRGKSEIGAALLVEASALAERNEERFAEPEIYRIKGELALQGIAVDSVSAAQTKAVQLDAEGSFRKAIEVASQLGAKVLEMRAVISLSCLLINRDRRQEARRMLKRHYDWFTEGFDSPELKAARGLLDELATATWLDERT